MEPFTRPEIAYLLGVHAKTIERWERDDGLPVKVEGGTGGPGLGARYDSKDVVRWFADRESKKLIEQIMGDGDYDKDVELGRLRHHQADIADMESRKMSGELLDAVDVTAAWVNIIMQARATLLALPLRLAQVAFSGASMREIEAAARTEIEGALNEMADQAVYKPDAVELEGEELEGQPALVDTTTHEGNS